MAASAIRSVARPRRMKWKRLWIISYTHINMILSSIFNFWCPVHRRRATFFKMSNLMLFCWLWTGFLTGFLDYCNQLIFEHYLFYYTHALNLHSEFQQITDQIYAIRKVIWLTIYFYFVDHIFSLNAYIFRWIHIFFVECIYFLVEYI